MDFKKLRKHLILAHNEIELSSCPEDCQPSMRQLEIDLNEAVHNINVMLDSEYPR